MIQTVLLDIEGTTTPIDFVHNILFPFARERMRSFVEDNFADLGDEVAQLARDQIDETEYATTTPPKSPESVSAYLEFLMGKDRKSTPLKSIQGKLWRQGYERGELRSVIFDDVPRAFSRWTSAGTNISIYSSGSELAQTLIFRYSNCGDLTGSISSYFDTNFGHKREVESYRNIVKELKTETAAICFVSDIEAELDAASEAGLQTVLSIRPGNAPLNGRSLHRSVETFDDVTFLPHM